MESRLVSGECVAGSILSGRLADLIPGVSSGFQNVKCDIVLVIPPTPVETEYTGKTHKRGADIARHDSVAGVAGHKEGSCFRVYVFKTVSGHLCAVRS